MLIQRGVLHDGLLAWPPFYPTRRLPTANPEAPIRLRTTISSSPQLAETEKQALVTSRIGQGVFKEDVWAVETSCRVTGVADPNHLIGSHIKPWCHSDNKERLDGENGLLLTPSIDHLFDKGHISFQDSGLLLISPRADRDSLARMGVEDEQSAVQKPFTHLSAATWTSTGTRSS
jgi:hypothetical protein